MGSKSTDLDTLREILLAQDREVLEALQRELDELKNRLDDPAQFLQVIEPVIGDALARHTRSHPDEVAAALAPAIAKAVKYQVEENRDAMITALMPIIGALIARSVREAVQNLARRVDERLRRATSVQLLLARLWARLRGVPPEELVLRDTLPWHPVAAFIIDNDSGLILAQAYHEDDFSDKDPHVTAALLTAIRNFARETFGNGNSGILYQLETDPYTVLMEEGAGVYIAWVGRDIPPSDARERLWEVLKAFSTRFGTELPQEDSAVQEEARALLAPLLQPEEPPERKSRSPVLGLMVVSAAMMGILLLCSWGVYRTSPRLLAHLMPTAVAYMTPTATPTPTPVSALRFRPIFTPTPAVEGDYSQ